VKLSELVFSSTRFLMLGKCDKELQLFREMGCEGIAVNAAPGDLSDEDYYGRITFIDGNLNHEAHFTRLMNGKWVKPLTVKDIFDQWGDKKYNLIMIDVPMLTRYLWYSEQIQVHMPKYHLLREDGHNEAVVEKAKQLGYAAIVIEGDWLLLYK